MKKTNESASSQREKRVTGSALGINKLTDTQKARLQKLRDLPDADIDFSDAPELTDEEFANAVTIRPNRAREYVGVRLDWDVLAWLKEFGPGHTTRINNILREVMNSHKEMAAGKQRRSRRVS